MKSKLFPTVLISAFLAFGCGVTDQPASATNANVAASTPTPAVSATPTVASSSPASAADRVSLGKNLLAFDAGTLVVAKTS